LAPVAIVLPALLWLDRLEAEPVSQLLFAFGWGAVVATAGALLVNSYSLSVLANGRNAVSLTAVLIAPWVEETLKGLAVLAVFCWRRQEFDGVVDGIVYAGLAGLGFAFTENVFYLGKALQENGTSGLAVTFVLRAIFGPFAHPLFTMAIGVGLGIAVTTSRRGLRILAPLGGLTIAIGLHALWNLSAVAGLRGFIWMYILVQLPIFLGALSFAWWARRRESRLINQHLQAYLVHGWFTANEVSMLSSSRERRLAQDWAKKHRGPAGKTAMQGFQNAATELAFARDRATRAKLNRQQDHIEATLLYRASTFRYGYTAHRGPVEQPQGP
jgi:protease PrsW